MSNFIEAINDIRHSRMIGRNAGRPGGLASLGEDGKVLPEQLPASADSVVEYPSFSDFPETGEAGRLYIDAAENTAYRWDGDGYVTFMSGGDGAGTATDGEVCDIVDGMEL